MIDIVTQEDIESTSLIQNEFCFAFDTAGNVFLEEVDLTTIDNHRGKDIIYVYVYGKERDNYPHLHAFIGKPKGDKAYADGMCLALEEPVIFSHGGHTDVFKPKPLSDLIERLKERSAEAPDPRKNGTKRKITWWKLAVIMWNTNNPYFQIRPGVKMPDYSTDNIMVFGSGEYKEYKKVIKDVR